MSRVRLYAIMWLLRHFDNDTKNAVERAFRTAYQPRHIPGIVRRGHE